MTVRQPRHPASPELDSAPEPAPAPATPASPTPAPPTPARRTPERASDLAGGNQLTGRRATVSNDARLSGWVALLGRPRKESRRSRMLAHIGGLVSFTALLMYVTWRALFTMPLEGWDVYAAWALLIFEAFPLIGVVIRLVTLWNIDGRSPEPVFDAEPGHRAVVFIPTYNEPVEVIAPTIAAACELEPAHQTWVLDDGDRPWVEELCQRYGARYVRRDVHDHAKAGNMNHAMEVMMAEEAAGAEPIDIIAVLDCDHVPLPTFLTATLGWFDDPQIGLVQGPQNYYNAGAFDDDGDTGEQGMFFHVLLPGRNAEGSTPFWCGSTSLIRVSALRDVGGISTATIVEDFHTTLELMRRGWKTAYHHQTLALGLAPDTPDQYLLQRRRWGMGCMQVLTREKLWAAKRWMTWRNYYEYLGGTLWWLEGVGTVMAFLIPAAVLISGAQTSTADPLVFVVVFWAVFTLRLWGTGRLFRGHMHWPTAFALRIMRIPVGISCLWWLVTRQTLQFKVTPKSGAQARVRARVPGVLYALVALVSLMVAYAVLGMTGVAPWHVTPASTVAAGVWLALAMLVLIMGTRRIQQADYATSRRNAYRAPIRIPVDVGGLSGELQDLSVGGAGVRLPAGALGDVATLELTLPGAEPVSMEVLRRRPASDGSELVHLRVAPGDWNAYRIVSLWLFHTPDGVVDGLPSGAPAVAATAEGRRRGPTVLARQYG